MIQKCSILRVLEIFFKEPTTLHFVRSIGKEINLAPTSVKMYIDELLEEGLIVQKKAKPFDGYVANLENDKFIFYKRAYNLYSLYEFKEYLVRNCATKTIVLFGVYSLGTDVESDEIGILVLPKIKKPDLKKFEEKLKRRIEFISTTSLGKLGDELRKRAMEHFLVLLKV